MPQGGNSVTGKQLVVVASLLATVAIVQQAVWVITDNYPPYNWSEVWNLFIAAALGPADYPVLSAYSTPATPHKLRKGAP